MTGSEDVYELLAEKAGQLGVVVTRKTEIAGPEGPAMHALDGEGRRILLIPVSGHDPLVQDTASKGVTLRRRELTDDGVPRHFLMLRCESLELTRQFSVFADEVLSALHEEPTHPHVVCQNHLDRWRELFALAGGGLLGVPRLAGLLAELHILERLAAMGPKVALDAWSGPEGHRHDFAARDAALEVKATTGREQFAVEIHGAGQLEAPSGTHLYLFAEQMEHVPSGTDSVPSTIDRLLGLGVEGHGLFAKLAAVGYQDSDRGAYATVRFDVKATRCHEVQPGFPRIVASSFHDPHTLDRVSALRYLVDLSDMTAIPGAVAIDEVAARLLGES